MHKCMEVIHKKEGKLLKVQARRGIIVASGGFGQNQEMRENFGLQFFRICQTGTTCFFILAPTK